MLLSLFAASVVSCNCNSAFYKAMVRLGVLSKKILSNGTGEVLPVVKNHKTGPLAKVQHKMALF